MTKVIVDLRILPKSIEVDLNKLEEKIKALIKPEKISREPIAFGLVAINIVKLIPDSEGEMEKLENILKAIEEVGSVEVTRVSRSL